MGINDIGTRAKRIVGPVLLMALAGCGDKPAPTASSTVAVTDASEDANNPERMVRLGLMLLDSGETTEAIRVLGQAVETHPGNVAAHTGLGTAYQYSERFAEAAEHFRKALELDPNNRDAHNNLGVTLAIQGHPEEAIKHFQRVLEIRTDDVSAHKNLGGALQALKRYEEAVEHYNAALSIKADDPQTHWNLGNALRASGQLEEAVAHYRDALQIAPEFGVAHSQLVSALVELGRTDEAKAHLVKTGADEVAVQLTLAGALRQLDRHQAALPYYEKALGLDPKNAQVHIDLATTLERVARFDEAVAHWDKALQMVSDNMQIMNNLAWLLATCPEDDIRDGQRALELAERAASLAEYKGAIELGTLAAAHAEIGNFREATTWQEKAIQFATDDQKHEFQLRLESYKLGKPYRQESESSQ